jgi:hypothetical protein
MSYNKTDEQKLLGVELTSGALGRAISFIYNLDFPLGV